MYMNVAITDPLAQQGLLAFDDQELSAAGPAAAAAFRHQQQAGPQDKPALHESIITALQQGLLYVVAVSRNCTGTDMGLSRAFF